MPREFLFISPAMLRTRYHERVATPSPAIDPALRQTQDPAANYGEASDAFAEWLGHLDAGRIEVR